MDGIVNHTSTSSSYYCSSSSTMSGCLHQQLAFWHFPQVCLLKQGQIMFLICSRSCFFVVFLTVKPMPQICDSSASVGTSRLSLSTFSLSSLTWIQQSSQWENPVYLLTTMEASHFPSYGFFAPPSFSKFLLTLIIHVLNLSRLYLVFLFSPSLARMLICLYAGLMEESRPMNFSIQDSFWKSQTARRPQMKSSISGRLWAILDEDGTLGILLQKCKADCQGLGRSAWQQYMLVVGFIYLSKFPFVFDKFGAGRCERIHPSDAEVYNQNVPELSNLTPFVLDILLCAIAPKNSNIFFLADQYADRPFKFICLFCCEVSVQVISYCDHE